MGLLYLLLIAHIVTDFTLQSDAFIEKKNNGIFELKTCWKNGLFQHFIINAALVSLVLLYALPNTILGIVFFVCYIFSHIVIDKIKIYFIKKKNTETKNYDRVLYLTDQFAHLVVLFLLWAYLYGNRNTNDSALTVFLTENIVYLKYVVVFLLLSKVANITFKISFSGFRPPENTTEEDAGNPKAGSLIGTMERILIFVCLITNNFPTLGFVLTAKTVARFKKLDKTKFAEYFIIGTLYSILYTLLVYYLLFVL